MCIIIYKPENASFPTRQIFENCFSYNDEGAGYSIFKNNTAIVKKGFMTFKGFFDEIKDLKKVSLPMAFHFRIGTSGEIEPALTHPFPISNDVKLLRSTVYKTSQLLFHNGILGKGEKNLSDTMVYIKKILYPVRDILNMKQIKTLITESSIGSRLLIFDNGRIDLYGNWITEEKTGIKFSNSTYKYNRYDVWSTEKCTYTWNKSYGWKKKEKKSKKVKKVEEIKKVEEKEITEYYEGFSDEEENYCPKCYSHDPMVIDEDTFQCWSCGYTWDKNGNDIDDNLWND